MTLLKIRAVGIAAALGVLLADQASKHAVLAWFLEGGRKVTLTPFMNVILAWNKGVSFSFLSAEGEFASWALIAMTAIISIIVLTWLLNSPKISHSLFYGLILGGALGNITDRLLFGAVVDFIDFHVLGFHWYTFNIADCGIVAGAILLLITILFFENEDKEETLKK